MIRVRFIKGHVWKNPALNTVADKWNGKMILIGPPVDWITWKTCDSDKHWQIREPEMLKDIKDAGGSLTPCLCRHMFEGAD